ncbi:MAG: LPP20 family lipoprotein [Nitrospirae bacterium]|nr:LPP20 family lipoprotein [Nitrospirota bacterium]
MKKTFFFVTVIVLLINAYAYAGVVQDIAKKISTTYPSESNIIGVGIVESSNNDYMDRRRAEVSARAELAKEVKVAVKTNFISAKTCEGEVKALFKDPIACNIYMGDIIEESVDVVLEGTRIVDAGEFKQEGRTYYYAIAVLAKKDAIAKVVENATDAQANAQEHLDKANAAKDEEIKKEEKAKAEDEMKKVVAYESQGDALEKVRQDRASFFKKLESH